MSSESLVSVLMGAYNCAPTLGASIESILLQDHRNLELLVCDDGSSDGTAAVIADWAGRDGRVRALGNERNRGLAYTLNRCIAAAGGAYLARMDGDDLAHSDRFSKQLAFLEAHPELGFCGSSIRLFDEGGVWGEVAYAEKVEARNFLFGNPFAHPTIMFRASCLRGTGGYDEDPKVGRSEDYALFMDLQASGLRGGNLTEPLLDYREDRTGYRKRRFRFALCEARVRARGYRKLGLLPTGLPFILKPILLGLLPKALYLRLRRSLHGKS